jgi:hypothetical protein
MGAKPDFVKEQEQKLMSKYWEVKEKLAWQCSLLFQGSNDKGKKP